MNILKIREVVEIAYKIIVQVKGFVDYASGLDIELPVKIRSILPIVKESLFALIKIVEVFAKLLKIDITEETSTMGVEEFDADKLRELTVKFKKLIK